MSHYVWITIIKFVKFMNDMESYKYDGAFKQTPHPNSDIHGFFPPQESSLLKFQIYGKKIAECK